MKPCVYPVSAVLMLSVLSFGAIAPAAEAGSCAPGAGSCCIANGSPGCDDGGTGCCEAVCACDPFCCTLEWDEICAAQGSQGDGCGAQVLCDICADADGDGVLDQNDVCCNTPVGVVVDQVGRPVGDFDLDCDVDTRDYRFFNQNFTGQLLDSAPCEEATCKVDQDCDDGLFCNGVEDCVQGACLPGNDPCDPSTTCDEAKDICETDKGPLVLTLAADFLTGTTGDDIFLSPLANSGQSLLPTLNNGDFLDGLGGFDTLFVEMSGGGTTTPGDLSGIEQLNIEVRDSNDVTLSVQNATSITGISNEDSLGGLSISNLTTLPSRLIWRDGASPFYLSVNASLLTGDEDTCEIEVDGIVNTEGQANLTITPLQFGNGLEQMDLISTGDQPNVVNAITDGIGTTWQSLHISGPAPFSLATSLESSVTEVDAGASSGGVNVTVDSTGVDTTCIGGVGDDRFDFSGAVGDYETGDTVVGGLGTDTLVLAGGDATVFLQQTNVTGVEFIEIGSTFSGVIDVTRFGPSTSDSATGYIAGSPLGFNTIIVPTNGTVVLNSDPAGNAQILSATASGNDQLTLTMNAGWSGLANLSTWEQVVLEADSVPVTVSGAFSLNQSPATETLTILGQESVVLGGPVTADVIDAQAFLGGLTVSSVVPGPVAITGGAAIDLLIGSPLADAISGAGSNDILVGDAGNDFLTGGSGSDLFAFEPTAASNGEDIISDFAADDILDLTGFVSANAPTGTVDSTDTSELAIADGDLWIVNDIGGKLATPQDVAGLFGIGSPFDQGVPGMRLALYIRETAAFGDAAIWFIENDVLLAITPDECVRAVILPGFNDILDDDNIRD
ncbi:MAG: hypothetical protein ACPGXK_10945 [Phycisphaerae bacterium]